MKRDSTSAGKPGLSRRAFRWPVERPPIRPGTRRNREDLGLHRGMRLCRTSLQGSRSSPAASAGDAIVPSTSCKLVEQTVQPGMTVSAGARLHGVSPSLLFKWS
jgi:hypothetical protein